MSIEQYTYLLLNIGTISIPFAQSFEHRITLYKKWWAMLPAIAISGGLFIVWDIIFTDMGVWGFNPTYLSGMTVLNLPLEEWLFFITVPYACVFTYEAFLWIFKKNYLKKVERQLAMLLMVGAAVLALLNTDKWYTVTTFSLTAVLLAYHLFIWKGIELGRFFLAWAVLLIPFFIVNGVLTGTGLETEVVWYNDAENLGIRMGTIPFEDAWYGMSLILLNVTIYERLLKRS